ncbi:unnamed protein product, partial [Ectocarpus sp. 12 AP-2014]
GAARSNIQLIPYQLQAAAHLANMTGTSSGARQAQRLRSICRAFFDECRLAEADAERGHDVAVATPAAGGTTAGGGGAAAAAARPPVVPEGVRSRLHECSGFVAVLTLLLQPVEEWTRCKRFVLEQLIRHAGARKARGVEGSGVEGRGGRRRSRSFAGPSSPRVSASGSAAAAAAAVASPSQQAGGAGGGVSPAAAAGAKRKRSPSNAGSSSGGAAGRGSSESEAAAAAAAESGVAMEGAEEE